MKKFKIIDFWGSVILIAIFTIYGLVKFNEKFIIGYFVVGGWQLISMIVHATNNWYTHRNGARLIYHWIVFGILAMAGLGFLFPSMLLVLLYFMIFAAPCMAFLYSLICYREVYIKMRRPLDILK